VWSQDELDRQAASLLDAAAAAGIALTGGSALVLAQHLRMVYETNEHTNLTRVSPADAATLHVVDSLSGLPEMSASPSGSWIDIGSGAGYPGIPLGVVGLRHIELVESVGRKAQFLERVVRELCLDTTVRHSRAEEVALERAGQYAAVAARAVSELPALVELAAPLLVMGGRLVCWKGDPATEELSRGDRVAQKVGMRRVVVRDVSLPGTDARRSLIVYERTGPGGVKLPRRIGLAQSKPLA